MIPILYDANETGFLSNGLGRLQDCVSCVVTEERNGIYECDFEYPVSGRNFEKIQLGRIIAVTHDETGDVQPFDIVSCQRTVEGTVEFHCQHISYRLTGYTVDGTNINSLSAAFSRLKNNATPSNPFTFETDKSSAGYCAAFDGIPRTVRSYLGGVEGSILDTYGGEYEWDRWNVRLSGARGVQRELVIRYGVNLTDYSEELDYSESYSSVIPFWSGDNGNGTNVVVKGAKVSTSELFGVRDVCVPLDLTDKFETKPTKNELQTLANRLLSSNTPYLPAQNISVNFVRIQDSEEYARYSGLMKCNLCDLVRVEFPLYKVSGFFKIVKIEFDTLSERYNAMELGTLSTSLSEALGISTELSSGNTNGFGAQSANYTGAFTVGNLTVLTGNVTVNVTTANTNTDVPVSFGPTFKYVPNIQVSMLNIGGSYYQKVTAAGPSTTGFSVRVRAGGAPGDVNVNWVAIGELA